MSKRTLFLIFALFIITFVLFVLALYKPSPINPPITTPTITPQPVAQTILLFGQPVATSSSIAGLNYSVPINIITGSNSVTAVQLEMQYDPEVLTNVSVTPGVFFKNQEILLNQIDVKTGRITYAFGVGLKDQGVVGNAVIATLSFEVKSATPRQTSILFLPKTLVTAEGIAQSVLKQATNRQFGVGEKTSIPDAPPAGGSNP